MSHDLRSQPNGGKDIRREATNDIDKQDYEGFDGVNYEQFRKPFNPNYRNRNRSKDERKDSQGPDEN